MPSGDRPSVSWSAYVFRRANLALTHMWNGPVSKVVVA